MSWVMPAVTDYRRPCWIDEFAELLRVLDSAREVAAGDPMFVVIRDRKEDPFRGWGSGKVRVIFRTGWMPGYYGA